MKFQCCAFPLKSHQIGDDLFLGMTILKMEIDTTQLSPSYIVYNCYQSSITYLKHATHVLNLARGIVLQEPVDFPYS